MSWLDRVLRLVAGRPPRPFEISYRGRDVLVYREGDLRVSMWAELLAAGSASRALCPRAMRAYRPDESLDGPGTPLTDERLRERIIVNIVSDAPPGYFRIDDEWGAETASAAGMKDAPPSELSPSIEPVYLAPTPGASAWPRPLRVAGICLALILVVALALLLASIWSG